MGNNWYEFEIIEDELAAEFINYLRRRDITFNNMWDIEKMVYILRIFASNEEYYMVKHYIEDMRCKYKTIKFEKRTPEEAKDEGYPTFNQCNHYIADMSHLRKQHEEDWMNTLSIKLPNGNFVTMCIMQTCDSETCIDVKFHGENLEKHRVIGFGGEGKDTSIDNKGLYALVAYSKK